jgi:hypothetical protein
MAAETNTVENQRRGLTVTGSFRWTTNRGTKQKVKIYESQTKIDLRLFLVPGNIVVTTWPLCLDILKVAYPC